MTGKVYTKTGLTAERMKKSDHPTFRHGCAEERLAIPEHQFLLAPRQQPLIHYPLPIDEFLAPARKLCGHVLPAMSQQFLDRYWLIAHVVAEVYQCIPLALLAVRRHQRSQHVLEMADVYQ